MTLNQFIKDNREELDQCIEKALGKIHDGGDHIMRDNEERRLWILNDEGLYNWARSEGVRI